MVSGAIAASPSSRVFGDERCTAGLCPPRCEPRRFVTPQRRRWQDAVASLSCVAPIRYERRKCHSFLTPLPGSLPGPSRALPAKEFFGQSRLHAQSPAFSFRTKRQTGTTHILLGTDRDCLVRAFQAVGYLIGAQPGVSAESEGFFVRRYGKLSLPTMLAPINAMTMQISNRRCP